MINYLIAIILDLVIGDPYNIPHPVQLIGGFISRVEKLIRRFAKSSFHLKLAGVMLLLSTVIFSSAIVFIPLLILKRFREVYYTIGFLYFSYATLSSRCLMDEATKVRQALEVDLESARKQVGYIVSRNTENLSAEEIIKATIETVAENTTDGVIAPLLYLFIGGPVLAMAFKGVSTLDSMVGYKNDLYMDLGWASAKADDILNYIPARIAGLFMVIASLILRYNWKGSLSILIRDHDKHESPNSAWTESAAAGALGIQLGGTHTYFGKEVFKPTIGNSTKTAEVDDISKMNYLMLCTYLAFIVFAYAIWFINIYL